jgi:hypothetical protein
MNIRFVAFASHGSTDESVYMVCILVDRAGVNSTRDALWMHERTIERVSRRFGDLSPAQQDASMGFFGGMRVLGATVFRRDLETGETRDEGRRRLVDAVARHAEAQATEHLVFDDSLGQRAQDTAALRAQSPERRLTIEHATLDDDPLLWIPESIAHRIAHSDPNVDDLPGWLLAGTIVV